MGQASKVRRIEIRWDVKGEGHAKKTAQRLDSIGRSSKSTASSLGFMRNAFVGFLSLRGVMTLAKWSDSLQLLRDRISVFTGSVESANSAMKDLQSAAAYTKSSIAGLAESYNRIALATKDLGLSTDAILGSTVALQQTFRLSGSTLAEATASTIQLSQGLASGAVRGQELRSVLEANAVLGG
ncbi:MAG: tape measure protein, partial [Bacteriovoracaceae bacterium]|nr:tape measure protein [Bacteriovoracaceae bacterium]